MPPKKEPPSVNYNTYSPSPSTPTPTSTTTTTTTATSTPTSSSNPYKIFSGVTFSINSYSAFKNTNIRDIVVDNGGDVQLNVTKKINFLLCSNENLKGSSKVKLAARYRIPLVSEDWILACVQSGKKIDESKYLIVYQGDPSDDSTLNENSLEDSSGGLSENAYLDTRWYWMEDDDDEWIDYDDNKSSIIEAAYRAKAPDVKLHNDSYIDFKSMLQKYYHEPGRKTKVKRDGPALSSLTTELSPILTNSSNNGNNTHTSTNTNNSSNNNNNNNSTHLANSQTPETPKSSKRKNDKENSNNSTNNSSGKKQKKKTEAKEDVEVPEGVKWCWENDRERWVEYDPRVTAVLEEAFIKKSETVRIDGHRYVNLKEMAQRRDDDPSRRRRVQREVEGQISPRTPSQTTTDSPLSISPHPHHTPTTGNSPVKSYTPYSISSANYLISTPIKQEDNNSSNNNKVHAVPPPSLTYGKIEDFYTIYAIDKDNAPLISNSPGSRDLGKDGAFEGFTVLIGNFIGYSYFTEKPETALRSKGFNVLTVTDELAFCNHLPDADVAWVLSGNTRNPHKENHRIPWPNMTKKKFIDACTDFHKKGGGLFVWADNEPLFEQANAIASALMKIELIGESPANVGMVRGTTNTPGRFDSHPVTTGIEGALSEGVSICFPKDNELGKMKILALSSDNHPCIVYMDSATGESEGSLTGRMILDCGWTKLVGDMKRESDQRYILNATVWLTNIDHRIKIGLPPKIIKFKSVTK